MKTFLEYRSFFTEINETADASLATKAAKSGISIDTLRKVYRRGVAAWNSGHRPGTTPQQWGMARVNSYITKGKGTYHGADKDLREVAKDKESGLPKKYVAGLSASTAKARAAHWEKMDKKSDNDPAAYQPAPGDARAKTKPSKHTLKYREMYGENLDETIANLLTEGVYDKHIFKVVFLAGGPGSGKSYVSGKILTAHGLRVVNSDDIFTMLLKKAGLSLKMPDSETAARDPIRDVAKNLTANKLDLLLAGRMGIVIDGTGHDFGKIKLMSERFKDLGYDSYMVFVNTSLEVARKRNQNRERTVDDNVLQDRWQAVQNNIGKFQNYFGANHFIIVDNNNATEDILNKAYKQTMKFMARPVENHLAKKWIASELEKKKRT